MKDLNFIKSYIHWAEQCSSKSKSTGTSEWGLIWRWGLGPCSQLRRGHTGPRWVLYPIPKALQEERQRQGHTGRRPYDKGARGWNDASSSQGLPRVTSCHQKLGRGMGHFSLWTSGRNQPCQHLDFTCWSPDWWENKPKLFKLPGLRDCLWQPQETNTGPKSTDRTTIYFKLLRHRGC